MTLWQRWKQTALHNKGIVLSSAIMAFGTLFYSGAAIVQTCMINRISKETTAQTDKLIAAANAQSDAASDMAQAASDQVDAANNFSDSAEEINRHTSDAVKQFGRLAKSSENNIKAIQDSSRLEQRAWVGMSTYKFPKIDPTSDFDYGVGVVNYGKTFALGTVIDTHVSFAAEELETDEKLKEGAAAAPLAKPESVALLTPNIPYESNASVPKETVSSIVPFFHSRGLSLKYVYVWGSISYNDVFKGNHTTIFCFYRREADPKGEIEQCKFHNDAN